MCRLVPGCQCDQMTKEWWRDGVTPDLGYAPTKPEPMVATCVRCNYKNEYAGPEHLDANGVYKCRDCKLNPYR